MKEKHVVLRSSRLAARDVFGGPPVFGMAGAAPAIQIDIEEIPRKDLPRITSQRDVVAVAPAMPMHLTDPRNRAILEPEKARAIDIAWGVSAVGADRSPFTGRGIVVAVLDTGIDPGHPAFTGVELVRRNFTAEADDDTHGHGTHCAGTIFGRPVGNTRIGVALGVQRALIGKVLGNGGGSSDQVVEAMTWAIENGANVISMSLGIDFTAYREALENQGYPSRLATSRALDAYRLNVLLFEKMAAFVHARTQPTLIVAAAGNESDRDTDPDFEMGVTPPAVSNGILSVAALDQNRRVAAFSNTGANISGPGIDILSSLPGGQLGTMSGTSMATPHVAGVAALWAERLMKSGVFNVLNLTAQLLGKADSDGLPAGTDPFDVGAGLVRAPLN